MSLNIEKIMQKLTGTSEGKLGGKVAVITGGTQGIGFATAQLFVNEGAYVFITGRRQRELDEAVKAIGRNVTGVQGDVAKLADLDRLYDTIKKKGSIDVLFANAGFYEPLPLANLTEDHIDRLLATNFKGLVLTVQKALALIKDGGSIILNASVLGSKGLENFSVYNATKAAVRSLARTWANELRTRRIRVNAVSPGLIPTEGYKTGMGMDAAQIDQLVAQFTPNVPLGRAGKPEEIARAVSFLASSDASYVTGTELFVDGGFGQV
jgi:NAD(P)-dependent dehydrogenase (short-subunit alcohol dehydrogenase family)